MVVGEVPRLNQANSYTDSESSLMVNTVVSPYNSALARTSSAVAVPNCNSRDSVALAKTPWDSAGMEALHLSSRNLHSS